jgi:hypothetical protein
MKSTILWALAALNVLLLALFVSRMSKDNAAYAQPRGGRAGDYIMIPGEVSGGSAEVVYVIDSTNSMLGAISYDDSRKRLDAMTPVDLGRVIDPSTGGAVTPPRAGGVVPPVRRP